MSSAASSSSTGFVPQYFEIREVGKRIKSSKKQYIWRFQMGERDITVELFNSKMSSKKKIMVNGQLKAEMKQKSDSFMYQMPLGGKRITLQAVNDGFDLVIDGTMFQVLWEQAKRKNTFTWESKNTRHDPFAVHAFGANIDKVVAPTTREHGTKAAMELGVMSRDQRGKEEERKNTQSTPIKSKERDEAIAELEAEREQIYGELKSSFGEDEAKQLIKQFMNGRYKKRMQEIERLYGKAQAPKEERSRSEKEARPKRRPRDEDAAEEQVDFESGFDHGFESMATFNGRSVGREGGPSVTASFVNNYAAEPTTQEQNQQQTNFDFNFDAAPAQQTQQQPASSFDLDDLLTGAGNNSTQNASAAQLDVFKFDEVQAAPQQPTYQQAAQQQEQQPPAFDPFSGQGPSTMQTDQQQQQPTKPQFVPNPMSHQQDAMMQQQMQMAMMAQQYQTNMMQQQMMTGQNPFASMMGGPGGMPVAGGGNPFMTNPAAMGQNAFGTFPQQQQPQLNQKQNQPGNPFGQL